MDIGIVVFAYNRSRHLGKVLEGLRENREVSKLYIFQDGLKCEEHQNEWEMTRQVIEDIDWCETAYQLSHKNKGLACSIVDGISAVFAENDAVIVLEDDCVPTANFVNFMVQCFEKYQNDKRVYSVSGYSWPIDLPEDEYDVYGCGRVSSWGWGTWKDRWKQYSTDSGILNRIKRDKKKSQYLAAWGNDCEQMLLDSVAGKNDSWAIYWELIVIENGGICINPYQSLIHNIGMDGTGVHCGKTDKYEAEQDSGMRTNFNLPNVLNILHATEYAFADLYGSYTASSTKDASKENVFVYGLGKFFYQHERELNERYNITAFVDRWKEGWYAGRKILKPNNVKDCAYDKIIIMVQSMQECIKIIREMLCIGIKHESILLGYTLFEIYSGVIDGIDITQDGSILLRFRNTSVTVRSEDEFNNVYEVFAGQVYDYFINNVKRDIVIDVGMNIGDSMLYFLEKKNVEKIYGYEPFAKTFVRAKENLRRYLGTGKIQIFQQGISNENAERSISFNVDMTCGQSTLVDVRQYAYCRYKEWGLVQEKCEQVEQIEVRRASEVFAPILKAYPYHNIILKLDCEGEEYNIVEELFQSGILDKFSFIMLEWHYKGKDIILDYLEKAGFSWWCNDRNAETGLVYAYQK